MTTSAHPDPNTIAGGFQTGLANGAAAAASMGQTTADRAQEGAGLAAAAAKDTKSLAGKVSDTTKGFFDNLNIGKILGGILGLGGAWFLGNFFGDGIFGTILTVCLAFPLLSIGMDKGGSWINGLLGKSPQTEQAPAPEVAQQPTVARAQETSVAAPAATPAPAAAVVGQKTTFSEAEMNAMLEHARAAGNTTTSITLVNENGKVVPHASVAGERVAAPHLAVPIATMRNTFAQCKANGYDTAVTFNEVGKSGMVSPTCARPAAAGTSQGR